MIDIILLTLTTLFALWAVLRGSLIRAAIALAATSVMTTILLFRLNAPLAAVFELSVCAGLITVVFMSTISLTKARTHEETIRHTRTRYSRYWLLPPLMLVAGIVLFLYLRTFSFHFPLAAAGGDVRSVLWNLRQADVLGQILVILAGVLGVVVLFKDPGKGGKDI